MRVPRPGEPRRRRHHRRQRRLSLGASTVYRNFFADKKYCEMYSSDRIKKELGLDRDRFIQLALLLGSDYTEGVVGVGVVNALEIVQRV